MPPREFGALFLKNRGKQRVTLRMKQRFAPQTADFVEIFVLIPPFQIVKIWYTINTGNNWK